MKSARQVFLKQLASAALVNLSRTIYVTTLSWTAMQIGGKFSSVGQVLLWGNVAGLIVSPFSGVFIDKSDRKLIAILGAVLFSASMIAFAIVSRHFHEMPFFWLLACIAGVGQAIVIPTQEAIIQGATPEANRKSLAPTLNMVRQGGLILGTSVGGVLVWISPTVSFIFAAVTTALSAGLLFGINDAEVHSSGATVSSYFQGLLQGARFMIMPTVFSCAMVATSAYGIGQVSNAVLPIYISEVLALSAWHFGVVDCMWSVGAFATALLIARTNGLKNNLRLARFGLLVMAFSFSILVTLHSFSLTVLLFVVLGFGFSFAKILSDSYLLLNVPNQYFGRVRSNISTFTAFLGICIYVLPTIWSGATVQKLMGWGAGCLIVVFVIVSMLDRKRDG